MRFMVVRESSRAALSVSSWVAVGGEVGAEGLDALGGFVGFGGVELVLGEVGVLVYGAREGC